MASADYDAKLLRSAATFFARWRGATAELFELTSYHKTLRVLVRRSGGPENLYVACLEPAYVKGSVRWPDCELVAAVAALPDGGEGFRLSDANAGLEVLCGGLEIKENVKV